MTSLSSTGILLSHISTALEVLQGSLLWSILYILNNTNLLVGTIDGRGDHMRFLDNNTAWIVGPTAEENSQRIQAEILPRVLKWEKESWATVEPNKTQLIHFTRNWTLAQRQHLQLTMNQTSTSTTSVCNILGVHLDEQLRMKSLLERQQIRQRSQVSA